jgi:hypothetical protein
VIVAFGMQSLSHDAVRSANRETLQLVAQRYKASPRGWAQIWAHEFSDAANRSRISTFRGRPSLPWAQGGTGFESSRPDHSSRGLFRAHGQRFNSDDIRNVCPKGLDRFEPTGLIVEISQVGTPRPALEPNSEPPETNGPTANCDHPCPGRSLRWAHEQINPSLTRSLPSPSAKN